MALTISEKSRGSIGGKAFRTFEITIGAVAASYITVTAASCGMNYFDHVMIQGATVTSADAGMFYLNTVSGTYIDIICTSVTANDQFELWAIGS